MEADGVSVLASRKYIVGRTYRTSSRIVVKGNSGPYLPLSMFPSLAVTGLAVP